MIDIAFKNFTAHISNIDHLLANHFSEADTRVKFIDTLLTCVLGWREDYHIRREVSYTDDEGRKCIDYTLSLNEPVLVVEAKKNLIKFEIPTTTVALNGFAVDFAA